MLPKNLTLRSTVLQSSEGANHNFDSSKKVIQFCGTQGFSKRSFHVSNSKGKRFWLCRREKGLQARLLALSLRRILSPQNKEGFSFQVFEQKKEKEKSALFSHRQTQSRRANYFASCLQLLRLPQIQKIVAKKFSSDRTRFHG